MNISTRQIKGSLRKIGPKKTAILILLVVLLISQTERLISQGTILGYQVRDVSSSQKNLNNNSGSLNTGLKGLKEDKEVCGKIDIQKVSEAMNDEMRAQGGFIPPSDNSEKRSSCIFVSKEQGSKKLATLLIRDQQNESTAKKTITSLSDSARDKVSKIDDVMDEAIFNDQSNQLTARKGKIIYTITATSSSEKNFDNKTASIKIAKNIR